MFVVFSNEYTFKSSSIYYADDRIIAGDNKNRIQELSDLTTELFSKVGLQMNQKKSKLMIGKIGNRRTMIDNDAYSRRITGKGLSWKERLWVKPIVGHLLSI